MATKLVYLQNDESKFLLGQIDWADNVLAAPNVKYQNGRMSHDCANEVRLNAMDDLLEHAALQVTA